MKALRRDIDQTLTVPTKISRQKEHYEDRVPPRPGQKLLSRALVSRHKGSNVAPRIPSEGSAWARASAQGMAWPGATARYGKCSVVAYSYLC